MFNRVSTLETEDDVKGRTNGNYWIESMLFDYNYKGGRFVRQCFTDSQKKRTGTQKDEIDCNL